MPAALDDLVPGSGEGAQERLLLVARQGGSLEDRDLSGLCVVVLQLRSPDPIQRRGWAVDAPVPGPVGE
ncbi:MAG: hypothetical protein AUJ96_16420 [Armatimonadetes bacterium CG2_30_66_41]|nr:MAG: hypothetical protein AUJ96_16420 [Armatimonadetes bacterium CG2_30_66_41]